MSLIKSVEELFTKHYGGTAKVVSFAPGRVEFIGNHTDYNQGPVIGAAINMGVSVALQRCEQTVFRFTSGLYPTVEVTDSSKQLVGKDSWVNYPLGVYNALLSRGLKPSGGFEMSIDSDLPHGSGLSSSAALELASAVALSKAYELDLSNEELALVGREAENNFVGVPCGILDQGVSACGKKGELVHIDCSTNSFSNIKLGEGYSIWIFNTHKKHSLVDSMYEKRHDECFEAAKELGVGYLADLTVAAFDSGKSKLSPDVAKRAEHVVYEIDRVNKVQELLLGADSCVKDVGALLFQSHRSSRDLFENSVPELDYLVDILESMPAVLGARLTGGGFGGAAMALTENTFTKVYAESVSSAYRGMFGEEPKVIHCWASDGARLIRS
ncbi:galactokinase [Puniceicoccaceae bacterium K14]|nr:galactokinase [Puniceicoccaceae bacterium K14]